MMSIKDGDSHDISRLVANLMNYVHDSDLVLENTDDLSAFFNSTTAKRLFEYCEDHYDIPDLECKIVGVESFSDLSNMLFEDQIELFPNKDDRFNKVTGEFTTLNATHNTLEPTSPISMTRLESTSQVATQSETSIHSESEVVRQALESSRNFNELNVDLDEEERIFESLLPTHESIGEATSNHLSIDAEESDMTEVIISQSEASLAMMHTLMSDELAHAQKLDIDRINRIIRPSIRTLESAKEYAKAQILYDNFIEEVRGETQIISEKYEKELKAYLDKKIQELEEEYRATVPNNTQAELAEYYASVDKDFKFLDHDVKSKRYIAEQNVLTMFLKEDSSEASKAIKKYVALKRQITDSAEASIKRLNQSKQKVQVEEEPHYDDHYDDRFYEDESQWDTQSHSQTDDQELRAKLDEIKALRAEVENEKADVERIKQSLEQLRTEEEARIKARAEEIEAQSSKTEATMKRLDESLAYTEELQAKVNELEQERQLLLEELSKNKTQSSDSDKTDSDTDANNDHVEETTSDKTDSTPSENESESAKTQNSDEVKTDSNLDKSADETIQSNDSAGSDHEETSSLLTTDDDSMTLDELITLDADNDALAEEFGLSDDDSPSKKKSFNLTKKHKIAIGVVAALSIIGLTFGISSMFKHDSSNNSAQTTKSVKTSKSSSKSSSKKVTDTIFKVGDVLNVTDDQGNSVDVQIREFKEDGSAVGEDSNKGKWLITREQIEQYAKTHSDAKTTTSSSSTQKSAKQETIVASKVNADNESTDQSSDVTAEDESQSEDQDLSVE